MKRIFAIIISCVALFGVHCCYGQNSTTEVEFDTYTFDFGKINEVDGEVKHLFKYKNVGKEYFVIYNISTTCGCTIPTYSKRPLASGASGELVIAFDPIGQTGRVEKKIIISANVPGGAVELTIKAVVNPRPRTIEDDYPVVFSDGVRFRDVVINGYEISREKETAFSMSVFNNSTKPARVDVDSKALPGWIKARFESASIAPKSYSKLIVEVNPKGFNLWGRKRVEIPILVNGKRQFVGVGFVAIFIEDFGPLTKTEMRFVPRVALSSSFYHFSTVERDEKLEYRLRVRNDGGKPLIIRYVDHSGRVGIRVLKKEIPSGTEGEILVTLDSSVPETVAETVRIITNDPVKPVVEFKVVANVK